MKHTSLIDSELFPPFTGFPKEGLAFLSRLKKNNNREWFHKHKDEYEQHVRFPMQCLVSSLAQRMSDEAPEIEFNPKRSIFRIYRDVRFSKNKAPYKTNIAAVFPLRGKKGPIELPGLYVSIAPGEVFLGGGVYMPSGDQLKAYRRSIVERPDDFLAVVGNRTFKKEFGTIQGENLQRAPIGFPKDHPMLEDLKHKQFYVGKEYKDIVCTRPAFLETTAVVFGRTMPLVRWLASAR
jgi:uncharacterized protein (TIGR02453 family)